MIDTELPATPSASPLARAGRRLCEPCVHLDRLSGPGLLRPLIHKGGLRVDVLTDGEIRLGAPVRPA